MAAIPTSGRAETDSGSAWRHRWRATDLSASADDDTRKRSFAEPDVPVTYTIDHDRRLVHAKCEGTVSLQEILDYLDAVAVADVMPYDKLFDASQAEFTLSDSDMMTLGARVSAYEVMDPRGPVA